MDTFICVNGARIAIPCVKGVVDAMTIVVGNTDKGMYLNTNGGVIELIIPSVSAAHVTTAPTVEKRPKPLGCKFGSKCTRQDCKFICTKFVAGNCTYGDKCSYHHRTPVQPETPVQP